MLGRKKLNWMWKSYLRVEDIYLYVRSFRRHFILLSYCNTFFENFLDFRCDGCSSSGTTEACPAPPARQGSTSRRMLLKCWRSCPCLVRSGRLNSLPLRLPVQSCFSLASRLIRTNWCSLICEWTEVIMLFDHNYPMSDPELLKMAPPPCTPWP